MKVSTESVRLATPGFLTDEVSAVVHRPTRASRPAFLLTHGAGGNVDTPELVALCEAIADQGHLVVRANLPYREASAKGVPRATRAAEAFKAIYADVQQFAPRTPWIVGGKSFGGRIASMAVADGLDAAGVLFYGYPLHPPGRPDKLRVGHWPKVSVPCLFLQGTRDSFSDPELLEENLRRFPRRAKVHLVEGGDHSLRIAKSAAKDGKARSASEVVAGLGEFIDAWANGVLG